MARIHGNTGRLWVGATSAAEASPLSSLESWSVNFATDKVETTALGDSNKSYVSGLPDAQGDFSGFMDTGAAQLIVAARDGLDRKLYLYASTPSTSGVYLFGRALFDYSATGSVSDAVKISGSWAAAGTITPSAGWT